MGFLDALNPRQREAVLHTEGPLLILAGAGSGKTRAIISRIAYLIVAQQVDPRSILAVTFTNKAAGEMRSRVHGALAQEGVTDRGSPTVATFHSFCVRLLRILGAPLADVRSGFKTDFTIYDDSDQLSVVKTVYKQIGLDDKFMKPRSALSVISTAKNRGLTPESYYQQATGPNEERLAVVFDKYQQELLGANALDFDDLLLEGVRLLRHSEEVRASTNRRYGYLLVDEYQDTNRPQYDLMRLLSGEHKNVCVVGDEDQSIYSWRGADIKNILDFERDFPGAKIIRLEQNYRSTGTILRAASSVVANNLQRKGKKLWTEGDKGQAITLFHATGGENEAEFVSSEIGRYQAEHPGESVAVLYRTNSQSRLMEEALRRDGRQYVVVGAVSFYQRAEVKDLLAYLKVSISPADRVALLRIINNPARGIGRTTIEQIEQHAAERSISLWNALGELVVERSLPARAHKAVQAFHYLIEQARKKVADSSVAESLLWLGRETGYFRMLEEDASVEAAGRRENLDELINAAHEADQRGEDVKTFLDHAALVADTDQIQNDAPILLMTFHSAKGLEFDLVAMIGLEEGIAPHSRSLENADALEEERRLCYVGMTRARKRLIVTCARQRRRYGGGMPERMVPSRFLTEIPRELLDDVSLGGSFADAPALWDQEGVDLSLEQHEVRETVERPVFQGKSNASVDHIAKFFSDRGIEPPPGLHKLAGAPAPKSAAKPLKAIDGRGRPRRSAPPRRPSGPIRPGSKVRHQKFGLGTVLRLEGQGDTAKLSVHFQDHGLKKLVARYAGLQPA